MSELQAAFLFAQLQNLETINQKRNANWQLYYQLLSNAIDKDNLPSLPKKAKHNGHLFYLHTKSKKERAELINYLHKLGIEVVFHYIPLHNAPIWKEKITTLPITEHRANTILRLPLYYDLEETSIRYIVDKIQEFYYRKD